MLPAALGGVGWSSRAPRRLHAPGGFFLLSRFHDLFRPVPIFLALLHAEPA